MTEPPAAIELCPSCRRQVLHERWCFTCGFKGDGVRYVRKDEGA